MHYSPDDTVLFAETARDSLQMIAVYGIDAVAATSQQLRELVREQQRAPVPCHRCARCSPAADCCRAR